MAPSSPGFATLLLLLLRLLLGDAHLGRNTIACPRTAPTGFSVIGNGFCTGNVTSSTRPQTFLCSGHACPLATPGSCAGLCATVASCTGFMIQDMAEYQQPNTCAVVALNQPKTTYGGWVIGQAGAGTAISGHDTEERDCCFKLTGTPVKPPPPAPPAPAPPPGPPPGPPTPDSALRLAPCLGSSAPSQQWQLQAGALKHVSSTRCVDFLTGNGEHPQLKPCTASSPSQAVQSRAGGTAGTTLFGAAKLNLTTPSDPNHPSLGPVSDLCLASDGTFLSLVTCGALSRYQQWATSGGAVRNIASGLCITADVAVAANAPVLVEVSTPGDASRPFRHWWKTAIGSGHAALTLRYDWREHLKMAREGCGFESVRFHGVFMDDMISVKPSKDDWTAYDFGYVNIDKSYDYIVGLGMKPLVELSFLPQVIANCSRNSDPWNAPKGAPVCGGWFKYGAINDPWRKDTNQVNTVFDRWEGLIHDFGTHLISRYGIEEVSTWDFELWNEMWGIGINEDTPVSGPKALTSGDYMELYARTVKGLKGVSPRLKVGGPTMYLNTPRKPTSLVPTNNDYVKDFASRVKNASLPVDFISIHMYPDDITCTGKSADGASHNYGAMCWSQQLEKYRAEVADILGPQAKMYCTEYSGGLFQNTYDTNYVAAFLFFNAPVLDWIPLNSFWAVSDVFEEGGIRSAEFTNQYGFISINGIPKPSFRAFELLNTAGNFTLQTEVTDRAALGTVSAFATTGDRQGSNRSDTQVFLSNFVPIPGNGGTVEPCKDQTVRVRVALGPGSSWHPTSVRVFRIDSTHANPRAVWEQAFHSAEYLNRSQLAALHVASANTGGGLVPVVAAAGFAELTVTLPAQGVVVLKGWQ